MPDQPPRRRARITFSDTAAKQLEAITDDRAARALDRALAALSADPDMGTPLSTATPGGPALREYADGDENVRVVYYVTVLRTVVVVAYIEA
jgi:plasmid stabilization system protein ParE